MLETKIDELTVAINRLITVMTDNAASPSESEDKPKRGRPRKEIQPPVEKTEPKVETPTEEEEVYYVNTVPVDAPVAPVAAAPAPVVEEEDDFAFDDEPAPAPAPWVNAEMLRTVLKELRDHDKQQVVKLMYQYKAKAFSDLDEADFNNIYAEAKALLNG